MTYEKKQPVKIWFIDPDQKSLSLYYTLAQSEPANRLLLGRSDPYEMRRVYLDEMYFSTDPQKLINILNARKLRILNAKISELNNIMKMCVGEKEIEHKSGDDSPF